MFVLAAQGMQPRIHLGTQVFLDPSEGRGQALSSIDTADVRLHPRCVTGEAQKVVGGKLGEEFTVDGAAVKAQNPLAHIERQNSIADPRLRAADRVSIRR